MITAPGFGGLHAVGSWAAQSPRAEDMSPECGPLNWDLFSYLLYTLRETLRVPRITLTGPGAHIRGPSFDHRK